MNIKELKEAISKLPDDMPVILGGYYRNNRHKLNLLSVDYVSDVYCKDNDAHGYEAAVYSDQEYEEKKQEEYEQYKFDLEEGETPKSIDDFWTEYTQEGENGFSEYEPGKCFVLLPELR